MTKKYEILKVIDPTDKNHLSIPVLANLPFKMAILGKSQVSLGKTTIILNLFLRKKYYLDYFKGEDIYIVSNNSLDKKLDVMMDTLDIPSSNYMRFDEARLEALYEILEEDHEEDKYKKHKCIIFDDIAYSGDLKSAQHGIVSKIVMNGRHLLLSSLFTSQKFSLLSTSIRSQLTGIFIGNTSNKELDLIETEFNVMENKKMFMNTMRKYTTSRDFVFINLTNSEEEGVYLDKNFKKIDVDLF